VLGFVGYAIASAVGIALAERWSLGLGDRVAILVVPPAVFLAVVTGIRVRTGSERIVFYETALPAIVGAIATSWLVGGSVARVLDATTLGIGTFLVFGRLGCFAVACCHGQPARLGVIYGARHVDAGLPAYLAGRPLWPTQLVEAAASLALVIAAFVLSDATAGGAALVYIVGYAAIRFVLELVRGDPARSYWLGASEAQWIAIATAAACAAWRPSVATIAVALALAASALVLVARRGRSRWIQPPHLCELAGARALSLADGRRHATSLGVSISCAPLPDGRDDWILTSTSPDWSPDQARALAKSLWIDYEILPGRMAGTIHVITPCTDDR